MYFTEEINLPSADFVTTHYVNEEYHANHAQLLHKHENELELLYIYKGGGRYVVGSREYALQAGDIVICNAGVVHGEGPFQKKTMESYCCVINELQIPGLEKNCLIPPEKRPVLHFEPGSAVEKMMLALYELDENPVIDRKICCQLSNSILDIVYIQVLNEQDQEKNIDRKNDELVRNISEYLDEHFLDTVNLKELGDQFHLSHYYIAHVFKEETGLSPMKYIMQRRIGEAQNMLMNTSASVQEISSQLGFNSTSHLSTVFKKYVGISPVAYRNNFQKNDFQ